MVLSSLQVNVNQPTTSFFLFTVSSKCIIANMCLAVPGKVKEIRGRKVVVDYGSEVREVLGGGVPVAVGDFVLVQMGIVVKVLTKKEAEISLKAWGNKGKF